MWFTWMVYTVLIKYREPVKTVWCTFVTATATDLTFPSEDIGIHITIKKNKHNVAPRNVYTKANTMNVDAVQ